MILELNRTLNLAGQNGSVDVVALRMITDSEGVGGQGVNRTLDTKIFSLLLYRLSYLPTESKEPTLLPIQE